MSPISPTLCIFTLLLFLSTSSAVNQESKNGFIHHVSAPPVPALLSPRMGPQLLTPNSLDMNDHTLETWLRASNKLVDAAPYLKSMMYDDWNNSEKLAPLTAVKKKRSDSDSSSDSSFEFVHEDLRDDALHTVTKVVGSHTAAISGLLIAPPTTFTCVSLPTTYDPFTLCSEVVDYPFMMAFNSTLTTMDAAARAATSSGLAFLNSRCLTDLKRMICATVHRPCVTNGNCNLFLLFYFIFLNLYLYIIFILD